MTDMNFPRPMGVTNIPRDKNYPADAVQCNDCGGWGTVAHNLCSTCDAKGWLPAGHPSGRLCEREGCGRPIPPNQVAIYCTNQCAFDDA